MFGLSIIHSHVPSSCRRAISAVAARTIIDPSGPTAVVARCAEVRARSPTQMAGRTSPMKDGLVPSSCS